MIRIAWIGAVLLGAASLTPKEELMHPIVDLHEKAIDRWTVVNDGVMGGLSRSRISADSSGVTFEGEVSLANGGGFASVRASLGPTDLSEWDGISVRVEGGGARFQLRLRTDGRWDGVAYRASFATPEGTVETVRVPFAAFEPTWRGRIVPDADPLDPSRIEQIGFLIADGQAGPFRLRIEEISVYRAAASGDADADP